MPEDPKTESHLTIKLPLDFSAATRHQIKAGQPHVKEDDVREYLARMCTERADVGRFVARRLEEHYKSEGVPLGMLPESLTGDDGDLPLGGES